MVLYGVVAHDGFGRVTEHLGDVEVERLDAITLFEGEVRIACGLTDDVQRRTLAFRNFTDMLDVLLINEQAHTLLTLVGDDFLGTQGLVADR